MSNIMLYLTKLSKLLIDKVVMYKKLYVTPIKRVLIIIEFYASEY